MYKEYQEANKTEVIWCDGCVKTESKSVAVNRKGPSESTSTKNKPCLTSNEANTAALKEVDSISQAIQ